MNFTAKPIPLPLDAGINRCLAHGQFVGDWCERRETCAAHETIKHDYNVHAPAAYRKCTDSNFVAYLPLEGFPADEDEGSQPATAVPALVFYPSGSLGEPVEEGGAA